MDDESFVETFQLAGWLLAHQASLAARGEVPLPLLSFTRDDEETAQLVAPRTDSDSYERQVIAGRIVLDERSGQLRSWAFCYDEDLELAGRALIVEVGGQEFSQAVTLAQRYVSSGEEGFRLVGDLEVLGLELLPPALQKRLESCRWRYLITEGATHHEPAGEQWPLWYAARTHQRPRLGVGGFLFTVPEGWAFRQTDDGTGWVVLRLFPWEERNFEPTVVVLVATGLGMTLERFVEGKKTELQEVAGTVLKAEMCESPVPSMPAPVARISWEGEAEGRCYRTEWVWIPTSAPDELLVLSATSFRLETWESVHQALEAMLASIELEEV
ncbi:MAG TPA: hypothetical protein VFR03_15495 [Thermoanaerobaculia bacterium]|nr:hypothetical protein [Thermoanaerobaculia bacterium]